MSQIELKQSDGRVFIDMPDNKEDNVCSSCGLCCAHFRVSFYCGEVEGGTGGFVPKDKVIMINPVMAAMKGTNDVNKRCVALEGELGKDVKCSIYHNRPSSCREFPVYEQDGSVNKDCQRLRAKYGLPPIKEKIA